MNDKCECVSCSPCGGTGTLWFDFSGRYLGNNRCDDLGTLEFCEECGGSGVVEVCRFCEEAMDGEAA